MLSSRTPRATWPAAASVRSRRPVAGASCRWRSVSSSDPVGQAPGLPQPGLLEFMTLNNKIALVTGAGRGIGREIARRLSRKGASRGVGDVDGAAADRVAEEIRHEGGAAASFQIDISDPAQVDSDRKSTSLNSSHANIS